MKFILLAATALLASPALAQTTPPTQADTMAPAQTQPMSPAQTDAMTQPTTPEAAQPAADMPMTQAQTSAPMAQSGTPMAAPADGTDPVGGYAPSGTGITGTRTAGGPVTFQPAMTPDQAFPAPAPMASYPTCKAGQFDNCMQASDARKRPASRRRR